MIYSSESKYARKFYIPSGVVVRECGHLRIIKGKGLPPYYAKYASTLPESFNLDGNILIIQSRLKMRGDLQYLHVLLNCDVSGLMTCQHGPATRCRLSTGRKVTFALLRYFLSNRVDLCTLRVVWKLFVRESLEAKKFKKSLDITKDILDKYASAMSEKDPVLKISMFSKMGELAHGLKDFDTEIKYYKMALEAGMELISKSIITVKDANGQDVWIPAEVQTSANNLALAYKGVCRYKEAREMYKFALSFGENETVRRNLERLLENDTEPNFGQFSTAFENLCDYCGKRMLTNRQERMQSCSRCKSAMYCNRKCQKSHWPSHKHICQQIQEQRGRETSSKRQK